MTPKLRPRLSERTSAASPERAVQDLFDAYDPQGTTLRAVPGGLWAEAGITFLGRAPEPHETKAIRQVVEPLLKGAPWSSWVEALPLVPHIDEHVRLHPLEKEAVAHLPHLQRVCHRPRLHLRVDEERVQVARARRIPTRAAAALVAHPGDWEHRTVRSIQPTRILATQVEDEWNLYENRLAARLVDHLLAWTGRRLDYLQGVAKMAEYGRDFDDETRGSRARGRRLYTLWGKFFTDDTLMRELTRTLEALERLHRLLQALLDSPLYRALPRGTFVPVALVPTNILANDPHYRKVAALWRVWTRYGHVPGLTRDELRRERQADCRNFDAFALLVMVHALDGLGYKAQPGASLPGGVVELSGPLGRAKLTAQDGALRFEVGGDELRVVPLLAPLDREDATAMWDQIRASADRPNDTVALLLGRPEDLERLNPRTARALDGWERPYVLPISPWSLDCAERVARVLRAWEAPRRFAGYPPLATVQPDPALTLPPWLRRLGGVVAAIEPPTANAQRAFMQVCEQHETSLRQQQNRGRQAQRAFDPGQIQALTTIRQLVEKARELATWMRCPVCENDVGNTFKPRPGDDNRWERWSWWCHCRACSSDWGTWVCSACQRTFPVLTPSGRPRASGEDNPPIGWLDRAYGRDLWAEPCWKPGAADVFRCTRCNACPIGKCARCT